MHVDSLPFLRIIAKDGLEKSFAECASSLSLIDQKAAHV